MNKNKLCFPTVSQALRENAYPFLAVIVLRDNRMSVVARIEGHITGKPSSKQVLFILIELLTLGQGPVNQCLHQSKKQCTIKGMLVVVLNGLLTCDKGQSTNVYTRVRNNVQSKAT